ncbi:hypothetical protein [Vreelandella populi]|uniref:hypothetical protein n=1 Tax=Vreelandella populi TaxID=2498858 RepID=UPI000F8ED849|nr:hypothetical protein [Halomonas populi]RUR52718.1 hypothetical protein ELY40_11755 [Halomonas populi]
MKWDYQRSDKTNAINDRCLISECKAYKIAKFTLGGKSLFVTYHQGTEIGSAQNGNQARRIAEKHKGAA